MPESGSAESKVEPIGNDEIQATEEPISQVENASDAVYSGKLDGARWFFALFMLLLPKPLAMGTR
jgi:hypothetical protein